MSQLLELPLPRTEEVAIDFDALMRETRPARPKLSDAIRTGALLTNPGYYTWFRYDPRLKDRADACAIGAACYVAAGEIDPEVTNLQGAARYFPELLEPVRISASVTPELFDWIYRIEGRLQSYVNQPWDLGTLIAHYNDALFVDRSRIAEIVEALGY